MIGWTTALRKIFDCTKVANAFIATGYSRIKSYRSKGSQPYLEIVWFFYRYTILFAQLNPHLLRHLPSLVDHQCHELERLLKRVFNRVALADFDDANVARNNLCSGTVVVHENSFTFQYIVRLCIFHVLVETEAAVRRNDEVCVDGAVSH